MLLALVAVVVVVVLSCSSPPPPPPLSRRLEKFLGGAPKASYRHLQKHSGILLVELVGFDDE